MTRIHAHGFQGTINTELTGWAIEDTRDGLKTVAGGDIGQEERTSLFAGGAKAREAFLRAKIEGVIGN